jgi:signal transduction histidine kinase
MNAGDLLRMSGVLRHRLRNHAAGIKSAISLLQEELSPSAPPRVMEYFPLILGECRLVEELTNRLSLLFEPMSNGQAGRDVRPLLESAVQAMHAEFPRVDFVLHAGKELADHETPVGTALATALSEVLRNAAESAGPNRRVRIECQAAGAELQIAVSDGGCGIAADGLEKAFLPFYTTKSKHIGIGLTIAARVLAAAQGTIGLERGQPRGLTVRLTVPVVTGGGR